MGLGNMAQLMGDDVIDRIDRRFDQAAVEALYVVKARSNSPSSPS